ncbi:cation diffusion facilitator family transporter [bacterium LRH843]|nr:cation diffusion facilitator family transporter [bacterium LRH843]
MNQARESESLLALIKKGNKSSAIAAIGNIIIAIIKWIAYVISGNGAMFATTMHSIADAVNQGFVFVGSVLSEKKPTPKFPIGFGRVINIFCMVAVIVVTIMAYETLKEGWHLIKHPNVAGGGVWLNIIVLLINLSIDGAILIKAMKEIMKETRAPNIKGLAIIPGAFKHVGRAAPPTRLVFYEDIVAVLGAFLALVAVVVTAYTNVSMLDGITTILIGLLMVGVAFRVGLDNMLGLIGVAAPADVEEKIANKIYSDEDVIDIKKIRMTQEGRYYHIEALIELTKGKSLLEAGNIKTRIYDQLITDPHITDVTLEIIEDDDIKDWSSSVQT